MGSSASQPDQDELRILEVIGEGCFGKVLKCVKKATGETVAVKTFKYSGSLLRHEAEIMGTLMSHSLNNFNIVEYKGERRCDDEPGLMFELLDISLRDYLADRKQAMRLEDIRTIIQDIAVALDALKTVGVMHTDLKLDNIMIVNQHKRPFKAKLIDFGLAMFTKDVSRLRPRQAPAYRAPEIRLKLPVSEAIDIWSLGCVMGSMVLGFLLFPMVEDDRALQMMVKLLGPPPDHLLDTAPEPQRFFQKTHHDGWKLKNTSIAPFIDQYYKFDSLDGYKKLRLEIDNPTEADERRECVELLKAMLRWDANDRITPAGILNHPFITKSHLNKSSHLGYCIHQNPWPPDVNTIQPADPKNQIHQGDGNLRPDIRAAPPSTQHVNSIHQDARKQGCKDEQQQTKRSRKNNFKRFRSWIRGKFGSSSVAAENVME